MAYAYCYDCGVGMSAPSLSDIHDNVYRCEHCGYGNILHDTPHAVLCEYVENLEEELRARVDMLYQLVAKMEGGQ